MSNKFTLEYSEQQGCFHLNNGSHQENTNGYRAVLYDITYEEYQKFTDQIRNRKITYAYLLKEAEKFKLKNKTK